MKKKSPIKLVQVLGLMDSGGIESSVMNYFRNLNYNEFNVDFIVCEGSKLPQQEEIERIGGKIYIVPHYSHLFKYLREVRRIFKENKYDIVHAQMNALSILPLYCAYKEKVKIRICHSHSTTNNKEWKKNILKNILKLFSKVFATDFFACSEHAGKWLYGKNIVNNKKFYIVNNAVDMDKFYFNNKIRDDIRKKLKVENNYVIGHIGRFMLQKNHDFIIDVFFELKKEINNIKLILVGDGKLEKDIKNKVYSMNLEDDVIFIGATNRVQDYMNAMDLFVFPSLYEGLGMVAIEAQINNLYVIASKEVPIETKISNKIEFVNLKKELWKKCIVSLRDNRSKEFVKYDNYNFYDIKEQTRKMENKYKELINYENYKR